MKSKSILLIGLGRFGKHLCKNLSELGNQIMILDKNEEDVSEMMQYAVSAKVGDCTNEEVLKSIGISNFDVVFICIGSDFQSSLEATSLAKELGAKKVISKATRDIQEKFLLKNGADEIIYPDRDLARISAVKYSSDSVFEYIDLSDEVSAIEILPKKAWIGRSLRELELRRVYGISVLGVKERGRFKFALNPDYKIKEDTHIMVAGENKDIETLVTGLE